MENLLIFHQHILHVSGKLASSIILTLLAKPTMVPTAWVHLVVPAGLHHYYSLCHILYTFHIAIASVI